MQYAPRNRDSPPRRGPDLPANVSRFLDDDVRGHSVPVRFDASSGRASGWRESSEMRRGEMGWHNKDRPPPGIDPNAGDWQCGPCSNWNWARRSDCNKCGGAKPGKGPRPAERGGPRSQHSDFGYIPPSSSSGYGGLSEGSIVPVTNKTVDGVRRPSSTAAPGAKRMGEGGGFREFDDEENERRKARAMEVARETQERKAERKKCEFCKRFACVC